MVIPRDPTTAKLPEDAVAGPRRNRKKDIDFHHHDQATTTIYDEGLQLSSRTTAALVDFPITHILALSRAPSTRQLTPSRLREGTMRRELLLVAPPQDRMALAEHQHQPEINNHKRETLR
jgi:hypothetical protein